MLFVSVYESADEQSGRNCNALVELQREDKVCWIVSFRQYYTEGMARTLLREGDV